MPISREEMNFIKYFKKGAIDGRVHQMILLHNIYRKGTTKYAADQAKYWLDKAQEIGLDEIAQGFLEGRKPKPYWMLQEEKRKA